MAEHIVATPRIDVQTLNAYIRRKIEPIYRASVLLGMLKSKGRLSFNKDGKAVEWRPRYKRRAITAGAATPSTRTFSPTTTKKAASLPWRTYWMGETISKAEKLMQQSRDVALFRIVNEIVDEMTGDFNEAFRAELYIDGMTGRQIAVVKSGKNGGRCDANTVLTKAGQSVALAV